MNNRSSLLDRIRAAQIEAGERVVMEDLRARGLADIVNEATEKCHRGGEWSMCWRIGCNLGKRCVFAEASIP